jgi:hypothetical protein
VIRNEEKKHTLELKITLKEIVLRKLIFEECKRTEHSRNNIFYVDKTRSNVYGDEEAQIFSNF